MSRENIIRYGSMLIGCFFISISISSFYAPNNLLSSGVGGVALIINYLYSLPIGLLTIAITTPFLYFAYMKVGKEYMIVTAMGMLMQGMSIDIAKKYFSFEVVDNPLLAAIYGGILMGIGAGIILRANGSTGAVDIISVILKKYRSIELGTTCTIINFLIMIVAAITFGTEIAMMTMISIFISGKVIDKVVAGFNQRKVAIIISDKAEDIAKEILHQMGRGVTFIQGEGAYTRENKQIIFVAVNLTQVANMKQLIKVVDPYAFMIIQDAHEVTGRGFTMPTVAKTAKAA